MNLFQIASSDQSVYYLGQIFGFVGTVLQSPTGSLLLGSMFKTINTTALVLGALLITHTTVVGLLKTAAEGEFLGKQWSSLWVPLRTVMGIAALFPTATGYSALQVVMMWVILQGVGAADTLWTTVLNYVSVAGSVTQSAVNLPTISINANMQSLFTGLVCEAEAEITDPMANPNGNGAWFYCADSTHQTNGVCSFTAPSAMTSSLGPGGACGNFSTCSQQSSCGLDSNGNALSASSACATCEQQIAASGNSSICNVGALCGLDSNGNPLSASLQCATCNAQVTVIASIMQVLRGPNGVAGLFAQTDDQYINFYENTIAVPGKLPPSQSWILGYCTAQSNPMSPANCCVYQNSPSCNSNPFNGPITCYPSSCATRSSNVFPSDVNPGAGGNADFYNTSVNAINQVYLPYLIQPTLGSQVTFIDAAVNQYTTAIGQAAAQWIQQQPPQLQGWEQEAQLNGWILAGAFYYKMAQQNNQNLLASMPSFTANGMNMNGGSMDGYRNNATAALTLMSSIESSGAAGGSQLPPGASSVTAGFQSAAFGVEDSLMSTISGGNGTNNPLASLQAFGESLLITAEVGYPILLILSSALIAVGTIDPMVLGSGITQSPAAGFLTTFFGLLNPLLMAFFAFCISFGGMLAIYTPFIPYIIFTFGAIGWLTATIEAMVAMPFVALGILSPGQSEMLGRAEPAIMIILNVFLRPTLMVTGMMGGMLMAVVVITMINAGFQEVMGSIFPGTGAHGPVEIVLFVCVYTSLIITSLNKCFALIYLIPERVLTYIGGQAISYGESESLGGVKAGAQAGAAASGGAVAGSGKAAGNAAGSSKKALAARKGGTAK